MDLTKLKTRSTTIIVSNTDIPARDFDIEANVTITSSGVKSITDGIVTLNGFTVATFEGYDRNMLTVNANPDRAVALTTAIHEFINQVYSQFDNYDL